MEQELVEPVANEKSKAHCHPPNYLYRIRWIVLATTSIVMLAYGHLLPTLYADLFTNLGAYRQFLGRFSFLSMLFLQVVYIFGVHPNISGREGGPKGDLVYLGMYIVLTLLPWGITLSFAWAAPWLITFSQQMAIPVVLYIVVLLPAIISLEILVFWRRRVFYRA